MRGESSKAQAIFCPAVRSSRWRRRWGCWQDPQSGYSEFLRPDAQFVLPSRRLGNFRDYEASLVGCWTGLALRSRAPSAEQLRSIPICAGQMTRLCCAHAENAGIDLSPLLRRAGLTLSDIEEESVRLSVASQIECLNLLAQALDDRPLGFHVALEMDLRRTGLLYYVAASSAFLGDAIREIARCSTMLNEGIKLESDLGQMLRVGFEYAGISRQSDRHQIEAWI